MMPPHYDLRFYQYGAAAIEYGYNPLKYGPKPWIDTLIQTNAQTPDYFLTQFRIWNICRILHQCYIVINSHSH